MQAGPKRDLWYWNSILKTWNAKGLRTVHDVRGPVAGMKIQAILRRTYSFGTPGNVLEYKGIVLSPSRCTLTWNGNDIDLTKNELRILEILMEHAGKVVSRDAIMTKLWESDSFIDDNTLTVNITRLRRKLEKEGLKEFIITKKGLGYMV